MVEYDQADAVPSDTTAEYHWQYLPRRAVCLVADGGVRMVNDAVAEESA